MLSTTSGTPASCAMPEIPSMSSTTSFGLPMVSPKKALVFGLTAAFHSCRSLGSSTRVTSMPYLGSVCWKRLTVPP